MFFEQLDYVFVFFYLTACWSDFVKYDGKLRIESDKGEGGHHTHVNVDNAV